MSNYTVSDEFEKEVKKLDIVQNEQGNNTQLTLEQIKDIAFDFIREYEHQFSHQEMEGADLKEYSQILQDFILYIHNVGQHYE